MGMDNVEMANPAPDIPTQSRRPVEPAKERRRKVTHDHAVELHVPIKRCIRGADHIKIGRRDFNGVTSSDKAATKGVHGLYRASEANRRQIRGEHMKYVHDEASAPT